MTASRMKLRPVLLTALAVLLLRLPVSLALALLLPTEGAGAMDYMVLLLREGLLFLAPALALRPWRWRGTPRIRPCALYSASLAAGVAAQWLLAVAGDAWLRLTGASAGQVPLPQTPLEWALALVALVALPAVAEELFFRGCVQRALAERMHPLAACLAASLLFTLMHGSLAGLPAHLGISLLLGACLMGGGSLGACMLLHGAYNAAALWWSLRPVEPAWPATLACGLLLASFLMGMLRRPGARRGRLTRGDAVLLALLLAGAAVGYVPDILRIGR